MTQFIEGAFRTQNSHCVSTNKNGESVDCEQCVVKTKSKNKACSCSDITRFLNTEARMLVYDCVTGDNLVDTICLKNVFAHFTNRLTAHDSQNG